MDDASVHARHRKVNAASELFFHVPGAHVRSLEHSGQIDVPAADFEQYRDLAARNTENTTLHKALGMEKGGSVYTEGEMGRIIEYLNRPTERSRSLRGMIYVEGGVTLAVGQRLAVAGGALIVDGSLALQSRAHLEVRHGETSRRLPGIVTRRGGSILVVAGLARM